MVDGDVNVVGIPGDRDARERPVIPGITLRADEGAGCHGRIVHLNLFGETRLAVADDHAQLRVRIR